MLNKQPGCQTRSRLTEKLAKVQKNMPYYPEEKQIDTHFENGMTNVFLENLPGVNPVVINYKKIHNKNQSATRPARYSLAWSNCFYIIICDSRKTENTVWTWKATCKASYRGRLAQCVS